MRRPWWILLSCCGLAASAWSAQLPMTTKDISLMLRSGYSSATVINELTQRHFVDTFDAEKEAALQKSGANQALIDALKSGSFTLSPQAAAAAREKLARENMRSTLQAEKERAADAAFQASVVKERAARNPVAMLTADNPVAYSTRGNLVRVQSGAVAHEEDSALAGKKYLAIYFSAHWCGPCRQFTPKLVDFYNRIAPAHPEFDILFVSNDRSAEEMEGYMREANMPWPALRYDKIKGKTEVTHYAGKGIPCLVLVDASGKVVSDSYSGSQYVGPQKVLTDIEALLSGAGSSDVAQTH